ncbi:MAG: hypothetical protein ACLS8D_01000 [Clostridioides difficile]
MKKKAYFKSVTIFLSILLVFSQLQLFSLPAYGETVSDQPLLFRSVGVAQSGTTYYVDGEGGNNANDGQSPASAWRDFEKVNQTEFQPGDHLLLNAQSTWNNQLLHPKGNGTADKRLSLIFMIRMTKEKPFLKQHGVRLLTVVAPTAQGLSNVQSQGPCS